MIAVLPVSAPHALDAAVGYEGDRGCYGLFWTPEDTGGWTVRISDGYHEWSGDGAGWRAFVGHALIAPHLARYGFAPGGGSPALLLVVDRETRVLLLYEFGAGLAFLAEQNAPWAAEPAEDLIAEFDGPPDPYDSLPFEADDVSGQPGDVWDFDAGPEAGLPHVEALAAELDRMQAAGAGQSPT